MLLIELAQTAPALATCDNRETMRQLGLAEEHRGWVELWTDMDNREALAELGYFSFRLQRAVRATVECADQEWTVLTQSRIRHEWAWHDRMYGLLTGTPFAGAAVQVREGRRRTSQQLGSAR